MNEAVIQRVLQGYGVRYTRMLGMQKGYRNESHPVELTDGRRLNLIVYKSEPGILNRIRNANIVSNYLYEQGFPTRHTADERTVRLKSAAALTYGALYSYLPGNTIPWEAYTMLHIKLLGKVMSDMHASLKNLPHSLYPSVSNEYAQILGRMKFYLADPGVQKALRTKLGLSVDLHKLTALRKIVKLSDLMPNQQILHMDFVRGNILFETQPDGSPGISGILDFEKAAHGHPMYDIARTLAFLLVDCKYKSEQKIRKYFLHSGYNKRGAAHFQDWRLKPNTVKPTLLECLIDTFLLYDFYKFLRHNPYEYLPQNEHFIRTIRLLKDRGHLTPPEAA